MDVNNQLEIEVLEKAICHLYLGLEAIYQKLSNPLPPNLNEEE